MFKAMAYIGGLMFLIGVCCGSIPWAAALVVGGGSMCAFGCTYGLEEDNDEYYC